jgi:hypothetical protein
MSQTLLSVRVLLLAAVLAPLGASCAKIGEEGANAADKEPAIILYGYDDDAPRNPPDACKVIKRVEVSIVGKDRFPEKDFRAEARDAGGTGVAHIRKSGNEEVFHGTKYFFKGAVVKCPKAAAPPSAAAAPTTSASAAP